MVGKDEDYGRQKKSMKKTLRSIKTAESGLLFFALCMYGLFYECFSVIAALGFAVLLILQIKKSREFRLPVDLLSWVLLLLPIAAAITVPFAIDSGMAALGIVKFLSVSFFLLLTLYQTHEETEGYVQQLPYMVGGVTLFGLLSWFMPWKDFFFIHGRFSGIFQYANGYAALLMVCVFVVVFGRYENRKKRMMAVVLLAVFMTGIIATGCRAVFFLTIVGLIVWGVVQVQNRTQGWKIIVLVIAAVVGSSLLLAFFTGNLRGFARYTQISFTSSSLAARLLYNVDGWKMVMTHPWGLGYKGFLFYQGAVQTGNYMATYAHNELLQTALDFGILPAVLACAGYLFQLTKKQSSLRNRIIFAALGIHAIFDWDFQFPFMLLVLTLFIEKGKPLCWKVPRKNLKVLFGAIALLLTISIWMGTGTLLEFFQQYTKAAVIYPGLTTSQMQVIAQSADEKTRIDMAESICARNDYCTIALQTLAERAAERGDFAEMTAYGKKAVEAGRYNTQGYEIYIYLLSYGVETANAKQNGEAVYRCLKEAAWTAGRIRQVKEETSRYAKYLSDSPEIMLSEEYKAYLLQAEALVKNEKRK